MKARIFQPAQTATQSGAAGARRWRLEYERASARRIDPLMGWTSADDTTQQLTLNFASEAEAVAFAEKNGLDYEIQQPKRRTVRPKSYAANFRHDRVV
jgi:hypothetical protein